MLDTVAVMGHAQEAHASVRDVVFGQGEPLVLVVLIVGVCGLPGADVEPFDPVRRQFDRAGQHWNFRDPNIDNSDSVRFDSGSSGYRIPVRLQRCFRIGSEPTSATSLERSWPFPQMMFLRLLLKGLGRPLGARVSRCLRVTQTCGHDSRRGSESSYELS